MRFTLFELRRRPTHWALSIIPDEADREATPTEPHSVGFYYAPRRYTVQTSLTKLRNCLIDDRRKMIKSLEREIVEIEGVEFAPGMPNRPTAPLYYEFPGANIKGMA